MNLSSCSCICGNVQIRGQLTLNDIEKDCFQFLKTVFSIHSQSIDVQSFKRIKKSLLSKTCIEVKCLQCGTTFRIFSSEGKTYIEKTQQSIFSNRQLHEQCSDEYQFKKLDKSNNSFVIHFSNLSDQSILSDKQNTQFKQINSHLSSQLDSLTQHMEEFSIDQKINKNLLGNKYNDDDIDFEIMFSNKYDPFVGSYELISSDYF